MKNRENFIPGIYNYCDRWCERCPFTHRCQNFQDQPNLKMFEENFDEQDFLEAIQDSLRNAVKILEDTVKEKGLDWDEIENSSATENFSFDDPNYTHAQRVLQEKSKQYYLKANEWLEVNENILKEKEAEINQKNKLGINVDQEANELTEAFDFIYHYLHFIHTKIKRATNGLHDSWIMEQPIQNDANGTAKVTLIAVERSIRGWGIIRNAIPESEDEVLQFLVMLSQILKGIKKEFPKVDEFIRPGFDENLAA